MAETWPSSFLPNPQLDLSWRNNPSVIRTQFDAGKTRQRQRYTDDIKTYAIRWEMTDSEKEIFEAWVRTKISNGNDWFNIDLPAGEQGYTTVLARFVGGTYSAQHYGVFNWRISARLELDQEYGLTETELDAILTP